MLARIQKWRANVQDEERSSRPSVPPDELLQQVDEKLRPDRQLTIIGDLADEFPLVEHTTASFKSVTEMLGSEITSKVVMKNAYGSAQKATNVK